MPLSHGVWGLSFKRLPTVCAKTVSSLLRESRQTIVYVAHDFFKTTYMLPIVYANFYRTIYVNEKAFAFGSQILFKVFNSSLNKSKMKLEVKQSS